MPETGARWPGFKVLPMGHFLHWNLVDPTHEPPFCTADRHVNASLLTPPATKIIAKNVFDIAHRWDIGSLLVRPAAESQFVRAQDPLKLEAFWSGRWDSNPRPQPWQGCALPLSYTRIRKRVRRPRPQPSYAKERQAWQPPAGPRQELAGGRIRSMGTRSRRSAPAGRPCRRARDRARCGLRTG